MRKVACLLFLCLSLNLSLNAKESSDGIKGYKLLYPELVNKIYFPDNNKYFWYCSTPSSFELRKELLALLDSAGRYGLDKNKYHYEIISKSVLPIDTLEIRTYEMVFTDAVIAYCKDICQGCDIQRYISNDEVSPVYSKADNEIILNKIYGIKSPEDLKKVVASFVPENTAYKQLEHQFVIESETGTKARIDQLKSCLNLYRWISHFHFDQYILVNIPSATLRYYESDSLMLESKVVAGKVSTRSPRFSTWCYQVVLYPYWNVPREIALKELLPHFKKSPALMEKMNMQLVGSNGKVVDASGIDWSQLNRRNFPYTFRQCTGCENSLGVIKFNLTDPFDVYLHDTNFKLAFLKDTRFLSHGCIRVEKPVQLGNYLLQNKLDSDFLKACYKDQLPKPIDLEKKVPVFVVYMPAEASGDSVVFYKDVYHLFK